MLKLIASCLCLVSLFASPVPAFAAEPGPGPSGTWPREYSVLRDDSSGLLTLSTPYYTVGHDLRRGGAISRIAHTYGKAPNLLAHPIETRVRDGDGILFSDLKDPAPRVSHRRDGPTEIVTAECGLLDEKGRPSGVGVKTVYQYRWGHIKIHKEFLFPPESFRAREVCPISCVLAPSLSDYGYREGRSEQEGEPPFSFGSCRWGKMRAGVPADPPLKTPFVPRYMVFADPGVEGLEWFAASDLSPWELGPSGRRGQGQCLLLSSKDPPGLALSISPLHLPDAPVSLKGSFALDCYLGIPILEGHAWKPWFHTSFNRNKGDWVSPEGIRRWAQTGIQTVHCHNDGDYYGDGLFWRDGSYPPYPDMERYDKVIQGCHEAGIRVATYFSNKELHPSTKEFQEHGPEWGRKDRKGNLQHNFFREKSEFGAQMCLRSPWLEFLKLSIDRVLKNHPLDGVYFDWNVALYCENGLHEGKAAGSAASGHWDIDELLDLMEWTRRRVGPVGLVIVHNTATPMFATENFANYVVAMEWGYRKWTDGAPGLADLPLEWSFAGARPRGVISYGVIEGGAPRRLSRLFALEALLGGATPWPASPETFELYPLLKPLGDIETYRFVDWRNGAVALEGGRCASAIYSRPGECYVMLANLEKDPKEVNCIVRPGSLPHPLASLASAEVLAGGARDGGGPGKDAPSSVDAGRLTREGVKIALPADGAVLLHIR